MILRRLVENFFELCDHRPFPHNQQKTHHIMHIIYEKKVSQSHTCIIFHKNALQHLLWTTNDYLIFSLIEG